MYLLKENLTATIYLETIYERSRNERLQLLRIFEESLELFDRTKPVALAELFSRLSAREAFILSDTCENVDGSTGNPLRNVIIGEMGNAIEYHPISVAFQPGYSHLHILEFDPSEIRSIGSIPKQFDFVQPKSSILNDYTFRLWNKSSSSSSALRSTKSIKSFTLMSKSKRSLNPLNTDGQVKTSFPGQITPERREIDWQMASDVISSSSIAFELAQRNLLPDRYWILFTRYIAQVTNDDRTTFLLRDGLCNAVGNQKSPSLPEHFTPITACALTSRNLLTQEKTLLESLIEFGFDGLQLFQRISQTMISVQLNLVPLGYIPDSHTQNVAYLFDFSQKQFVGLLNRDVECEKLIWNRLQSLHVDLPDREKISPKLLRDVSTKDEKLFSLYLHHTIYTKHIVPMAQILHDKYQIESKILCDFVKQCLIDWTTKNVMPEEIDFSGRFYERNLACKTLQIGDPPHYRLIRNHPLLPSYSLKSI